MKTADVCAGVCVRASVCVNTGKRGEEKGKEREMV